MGSITTPTKSSLWEETFTRNQKRFKILDTPDATEVTFPLVLRPSQSCLTLADALEQAKDLSPKTSDTTSTSTLRRLLDSHGGAIHLKNLPLRSASDFSEFLDGLAGKGQNQLVPHEPIGMNVLRKEQAKNVLTVNEGPPTQVIYWHNEFGFSTSYPCYVVFFCLQPSKIGGNTAVSSSLAAYNRLKKECPRIIKNLIEKGVSYPAYHPIKPKDGQLIGNGLYKKSAFGPADGSDISVLSEIERKRIVDQNIRALAERDGWREGFENDLSLPIWKRRGFNWAWKEDGTGVEIKQRVPGIRIHPTHNVPTLWTSIGSRYVITNQRDTWKWPHTYINDNSMEEVSLPPMYAGMVEDEPMLKDEVTLQNNIQQEFSSNIEWETGDILIIDNFACQHSRMTWEGPRTVLASFWDQKGMRAQPIETWTAE